MLIGRTVSRDYLSNLETMCCLNIPPIFVGLTNITSVSWLLSWKVDDLRDWSSKARCSSANSNHSDDTIISGAMRTAVMRAIGHLAGGVSSFLRITRSSTAGCGFSLVNFPLGCRADRYSANHQAQKCSVTCVISCHLLVGGTLMDVTSGSGTKNDECWISNCVGDKNCKSEGS